MRLTTMGLGTQLIWLVVLAVPVACVSWTFTHEEIFREPREYCEQCSQRSRRWWQRKFFYVFTCHYCFSHYVAIATLAITRYHLLYEDWRGYLIAGLALVWLANQYMALYARLQLEIRKDRVEISGMKEQQGEEQSSRSSNRAA